MSLSDEQVRAFVKDYRAVCERHGLVIPYDDFYVAHEVLRLPDDMDWDEFSAREDA